LIASPIHCGEKKTTLYTYYYFAKQKKNVLYITTAVDASFSKVLCVVTLHRKCPGALTFENASQVDGTVCC
jgi:hypothetical protein